VAVESFLLGHIRFTDIADIISEVMQHANPDEPCDLDGVLAIDDEGRRLAREALSRRMTKRL